MKSLVVFAGWAVVAWAIVVRPAWLIGPGSLLANVLPGSQGFPGFEGVEAILFVATLPVLVAVSREARA